MDAIRKAKRFLQTRSAPVVPPVTGAFPRMKLGMNMQPYTYYERLPGPINMFPGSDGFGAAPVDVDGWPTSDFQTCPRIGPATGAAFEATISFTGQATVAIGALRTLYSTVSAVTYDAVANRSTCTAMCTPDGANNLTSILAFTNTKRTAGSAIGSGITNVDMRRTDKIGFVGMWDPQLIAYMTDFSSVVRMMDMQDTNNDDYTTTWASRRKGPMQCGSIEAIVKLAVEARIDLWLQIPMNATDDYDNNFFTYLRDNLPAQTVVYFGYANELWNYGFNNAHTVIRKVATAAGGALGTETSRAIVSMARAGGVGTITVDYVMDRVVGQHLMVIDGTGVIGTGSYVVTAVTANTVSFASPGVDGSASPGSNTWFVCNEALTVNGLPQNDNLYALGGYWAVRRLVQAAERCRVIVGDAAMRTRFRPILEGQGVEPSAGENELQNAKTIVEGMGFTWANQKHVYGIAGAPYADVGELPDIYCNSGDTCPVKTEAEYLSAFLNRMNQLRYQYLFQQRSGNAAKFGVKQLCYEGGPSNVFNPGAANMNRRTAAKNTQAFADAHLQVLRDMARSGNDLYMHYASTQTLNHWGFTDDIKVVTPLWQSFRDYLTVPALAPQNVLTATGTSVIDGRSTLGTWETVFTNPALPGLATPTNNRARYQLYVDNDCTKTLTLNVASAGDSGVMHVDLMVNGIVVQANVALPVTGGFELSTFADLIFSPMVLKQGVCLLELIAKENHGAGNNEAFKRLTFS